MDDDLYDGHYQTEYKGPVGFEKKAHKTHFTSPGISLVATRDNGYEWREVKPGRWLRVKKEYYDNIIQCA
jgi:hypothetical protein